jgi:hypothetical protein
MPRGATVSPKTMTIKPANSKHIVALLSAIAALKRARAQLKIANCPKTLQRVRLCLTSAQGAERHMAHRASRTNRDGSVRNWSEIPQ